MNIQLFNPAKGVIIPSTVLKSGAVKTKLPPRTKYGEMTGLKGAALKKAYNSFRFEQGKLGCGNISSLIGSGKVLLDSHTYNEETGRRSCVFIDVDKLEAPTKKDGRYSVEATEFEAFVQWRKQQAELVKAALPGASVPVESEVAPQPAQG